jgi:hypothetical protein
MIAVQFKTGHKRSRWQTLSYAASPRWASWQSLGWMIVYKDGCWKEVRHDMTICEELLSALRGRQAKLDAPMVLDACEMAGVGVFLAGDGLKVQGPITDDIRFDLKRCKAEIVEILKTVPEWSDADCNQYERTIRERHQLCHIALYPPEDDVFSVAARNVLADALAAFTKGKAVRRMDHCQRRFTWLLAWFATLETTLELCRKPGGWAKNREAMDIDLADFEER